MEILDFKITSDQKISSCFRERGLHNFQAAAGFICKLPYKRNANKFDPVTVFEELCGTCSSKHAVLKLLVTENEIPGVQLMLGIFKMKASGMPKIRATLEQYGLQYIPEAHNYLRIRGAIADYTWVNRLDFSKDLLAEQEITPEQITDYKAAYHRSFLKDWLQANTDINYSLEELWEIREQCIRDLAS